MNGKLLLDALMGRCGSRTSPELRAKALTEMVLIQQTELEGDPDLPWFLITEQASTATVVGEARVPLPGDFLIEVEDDNLMYLDPSSRAEIDVEKRGYDEARAEFDNADPGAPQCYAIRGNYIVLFPAPDLIYTILFPSYYARQQAPVDDASFENAWMKYVPDLMIGKTGLIINSLYLKDPDLTTIFGAILKKAEDRFMRFKTAREESNRERRKG